MQPAAVIRILKPNVTSLGYALFLAINAAGVWGGVFPFLPLEDVYKRQALYRAKSQGKAHFCFYEPGTPSPHAD